MQDPATNICKNILPPLDLLRAPHFKPDMSALRYRAQRNDRITDAVITGYAVIRFEVSMIGQYANAGGTFKIHQALPGVQYRIIALAFKGNMRRSASAVKHVSTAAAGECGIYSIKQYVLYYIII